MQFAMKLTGRVKTRPMIACEECGREFQRNRKSDLVRHMRIHTNEKPFVCPHPACGKAFRQSSALKNHSNFHVRDDTFTCAECKMNFFDKPTYNRHVRELHDLEYVYACTITGCKKHFKRKPVFKAHMKDKHRISYNEAEILIHRVSAEPYIKSANGSKAAYHSGSAGPFPLPKLSEALQSVRSPQPPNASFSSYYSSVPIPYMNNGNSVVLSDPYSKPVDTYSTAPFIQADPSEYTRYGPASAADFWFPSVPMQPMDTSYYNGQIVAGPGAEYMDVMPANLAYTPAPSPPNVSPNLAFVYSSGTSFATGSGSGSAGSYSPHSPFSRASSSSPVSATGSIGSHYGLQPTNPLDRFVLHQARPY